MSRRVWATGLVSALVLAAAGLAATQVLPEVFGPCGQDVEHLPADASDSPFLDAAGRAEQPDPDRDRLVAALEEAPAPFGEVVGAVGYHYDQWARVGAYATGLGVRTRDNPGLTMLDDATLEPRWTLRVRTARSAYDAGESVYLAATLTADAPPDLVASDLRTGERRWCTTLGAAPVGEADPFATAVLDGGDVVTLTSDGKREQVTRLSGRDGSVVWRRTLDAGAGDHLGVLGEGLLLVGGRPRHELLDDTVLGPRAAGPGLVALSAHDGAVAWTHPVAAGSDVHVLGTDPVTRTTVVLARAAGAGPAALTALDADGRERWRRVPERGAYDAALRAGRVVVRAGTRWSAYNLGGERIWRRVVPTRPQFLPYGFELAAMPLLDADHALVGGTTALHLLDLRNGTLDSTPLPTDGINTTYWPYELAVTPALIAVATNTAAVVVRRE